MKMSVIPAVATLLLAALLFAPVPPLAQTSQPKPDGDSSPRELGETMGQMMGQMGRMMGDMAQTMGSTMQRMMDAMQKEGPQDAKNEHIEGKLAFLKAELHITPAQETAWIAFADAMRKAVAMKSATGREGRGSTLPERLEQQTQTLQGRLAILQAKKAAIDKLYSQLDSKQKTLADDLIEQIGLV